jgi:hypothetical protein
MVSVGVDVCRVHGGKSLRGSQAGGFKTGRYSKVLPVRLSARYDELLQNDTEIMDMRTRAVLLETRLTELLTQLDDPG